MALDKYNQKRRFEETPEPAGKKRKGSGPLNFVVQKHEASRLHYDFRLEVDGVLKSWAVPKGPSLNPHDRRLAMMVEDHPFDYRTFEGIIPEGNYGAGTVMVWDQGTYAPWADVSGKWQEIKDRAQAEKKLRQMLKAGHLTFILHGSKLHGEFALIKIKDSDEENAWLLIKKGDETADPKRDVTSEDHSVVSGRSMEQIAAASDKQWTSSELDLSDAPKAKLPDDVKPMLASLTDQPFDNSDWVFEIKWDGYRAIAETGKGVKLYSRNLQPFNEKFAPVVAALQDFKHEVVLDGEVVAVDPEGRSRFQLLQNYQTTGQGTLVYYVFDILHLDGHDLTGLPLLRRKEILTQILPPSGVIKLSQHIEQKGTAFFAAAAEQNLEGIMAKAANSTYRMGSRSKQWLKIKTHQRQEAVIGGFTEPRGSRKSLGALVLGVYDGDDLIYIGHTGGGFDDKGLKEMHQKLQPLIRETSPFSTTFKTNAPVSWVEPKLVCEVSFAEWTGDGHMRQPILVGLREDKDSKSVVREQPLPATVTSEAAKSTKKKSPTPEEEMLQVGKNKVKITHRGKVYWPEEGYSKGQLIDYYRQAAPLILPYLKDRPENLNRHPNGIAGPSFYHKDMRGELPDWIKTIKIYSESNEAEIEYLVCNDEATLVYMANLGCIEINPWNSRIKKLDNPDYTIIDLDPEDIGFDAVIKTAQAVHKVLDSAGIPSYPKTSGATGLHIYIPLGAKYDYEQSKTFAHIIGQLVNAKLADITSLERNPAKRQRRVYLDYLQNRHGQTLASVYSVRPKPGATVSTPLKWQEVKAGLDPKKFTMFNILKRVDKLGDLWQPVIRDGIDLAASLERLGDKN